MKKNTAHRDFPFQEQQLSLFESKTPEYGEKQNQEKPSIFEFIRARLDHGPEMTQEEYKRWIKILVQHSIKRME